MLLVVCIPCLLRQTRERAWQGFSTPGGERSSDRVNVGCYRQRLKHCHSCRDLPVCSILWPDLSFDGQFMQRSFKGLTSQALKHASLEIPASVQVTKQADQLVFSGPLGTTRLGLSKVDTQGCAALKLDPDKRTVEICSISKPFFGTLTTLIKNKLHGVTQGYLAYLRIQGIGYRAAINGASPIVACSCCCCLTHFLGVDAAFYATRHAASYLILSQECGVCKTFF